MRVETKDHHLSAMQLLDVYGVSNRYHQPVVSLYTVYVRIFKIIYFFPIAQVLFKICQDQLRKTLYPTQR